MLARLGTKADLNRKDYFYEPKLDGYRALCYVTSKGLTFISRRGNDITHRYPELDFRKQIKAKTAILDGEIIVYDDKGFPNFNMLQQRSVDNELEIEARSTIFPATYVIFDILMKDGKSLLNVPLVDRRSILEKTVKPKQPILELIIETTNGKALWKAIQKINLEGVMAKREDSLYHPGLRTPEWIKIKRVASIDCLIMGFTQEKRLISALALALYDKKGNLHYVGKVGTGFKEADLIAIHKKLKPLIRKNAACPCPLKNVTWVKPNLPCEIEFHEFTKDKRLRAPSFIRLRSDKDPHECTFTQ